MQGLPSPPAAQQQVQVVLRIRPLLRHERPLSSFRKPNQAKHHVGETSPSRSTAIPHTTSISHRTLAISDDHRQVQLYNQKRYQFDGIYDPDTRQETLYETSVRPMIERCFLQKWHATIFAYGQTGSGKTFTMGNPTTAETDSELEGAIPRTIRQVFQEVQELLECEPDTSIQVQVSFLEIYREEIFDLFATTTSNRNQQITIREDRQGKLIVSGLTQANVASAEEACKLLCRGMESRTTGRTNVHDHSSRSHAIFTITVHMVHKYSNDQVVQERKQTFKINLVDLAGSERLKKTKLETGGVRFKESVKINSGLLALGNVIRALVEKQQSDARPLLQFTHQHIPYRASKLTRFLQDGLGGNSLTLMIACVSPAFMDYEETANTVWYASRARFIRNTPKSSRVQFHEIRLPSPEHPEQEEEEEEKNVAFEGELEELSSSSMGEEEEEQDEEVERAAGTSFVSDAALMADLETLSKEEWLGKYIDTLRQRTIKALNATNTLQHAQEENQALRQTTEETERKLKEACEYIEHLVDYISSCKLQLERHEADAVHAHQKDDAVLQLAVYLREISDLVRSRNRGMMDEVEVAREQAHVVMQESFPEECLVVFEWIDKILGSLESSSVNNSLIGTEALKGYQAATEQNTQIDLERQHSNAQLLDSEKPLPTSASTGAPLFTSKPATINEPDEVETEEESRSRSASVASADSRAPSTVSSLKRRLSTTAEQLGRLRLGQVEQDAELEKWKESAKVMTMEREELLQRLDQQEEHLQDYARAAASHKSVASVQMQTEHATDEESVLRTLVEMMVPNRELLGKVDWKDAKSLAQLLEQVRPAPPPPATAAAIESDSENKSREALEKDNFYYRRTNRELKQKLREFMAVHEKQTKALLRAKEMLVQMKGPTPQNRMVE